MSWSVFPNPQVLDSAKSFYDAAEILDRAGGNALPIINLRCHAIELFLKSLHLGYESIDQGDGIALLRTVSGRKQGHGLCGSFEQALAAHQSEILKGYPDLEDSLVALDGVFQESRYIYETGNSLPLGTARRVVQHLAVIVPKLERLALPISKKA